MKTIREIAAMGIMPEHALRFLVKNNKVAYVTVGKNKVLVNYTALCEQLARPDNQVKEGATVNG
jgi:hypothetical protein